MAKFDPALVRANAKIASARATMNQPATKRSISRSRGQTARTPRGISAARLAGMTPKGAC